MNEVDEETNKDVYLLQAPTAGNNHAQSDETGAIIGAVVACLTITGVLFFLWKILQKKQNEVLRQIDVVEAAAREMTRTKAREDAQKHRLNERRSYIKLATSSRHVAHPYSTMNIENEFEAVSNRKNPQEELVLPPLSPLDSICSIQDEMISSDTGYNSGVCRKDPVSKSCNKNSSEEIYLEHPHDIIQSLKRDRQHLRKKQGIRLTKVRNAIEIINQCQASIRSTKENLSLFSKETYFSMKQLRRSRRERLCLDIRRSKWKRWDSGKQLNFDQKEAFVCMQERFDDLHVHLNIREIAEDVFLLRSHHRSQAERNEHYNNAISDCMSHIRSCIEDASTIKHKIRLWLNPDARHDVYTENSSRSNMTNVEVTKSRRKQRAPLPRLLKSNAVRPTIINTNEQDIDLNKSADYETGNRCVKCHRYFCQCVAENEIKDFDREGPGRDLVFLNATKTLSKAIVNSSNELNAYAACHQKREKLEATSIQVKPFFGAKTYLLTFKLHEVGGSEADVDQNLQLSEREVHKALQRVPSILSLKTVKKESFNEWTVVAESTQQRVANIRFNCKRKAYIIEMCASRRDKENYDAEYEMINGRGGTGDVSGDCEMV